MYIFLYEQDFDNISSYKKFYTVIQKCHVLAQTGHPNFLLSVATFLVKYHISSLYKVCQSDFILIFAKNRHIESRNTESSMKTMKMFNYENFDESHDIFVSKAHKWTKIELSFKTWCYFSNICLVLQIFLGWPV